jgi:hypothetical protein
MAGLSVGVPDVPAFRFSRLARRASSNFKSSAMRRFKAVATGFSVNSIVGRGVGGASVGGVGNRAALTGSEFAVSKEILLARMAME